MTYKTIAQSRAALSKVQEAKKVAIVGAGLIGFELAESLSGQDKEVFLIDRMDTLLFSATSTKRFLRFYDRTFSRKFTNLSEQQRGSQQNKLRTESWRELNLPMALFCQRISLSMQSSKTECLTWVADFLKLNPDGRSTPMNSCKLPIQAFMLSAT